MENHHVWWENQLLMAIFNSYVSLPEGTYYSHGNFPSHGLFDYQMVFPIATTPRPKSLRLIFNGHFRNRLIGGTYKGYVREYPHKIWPYMVQYLHFRILEFPLIYCHICSYLLIVYPGHLWLSRYPSFMFTIKMAILLYRFIFASTNFRYHAQNIKYHKLIRYLKWFPLL